MIHFDDLDDAIFGPALVWQDGARVSVLVYDGEKIRDILMRRDGMSFEDAREFIEFNVEGAFLGPQTPVVVWPNDMIWSMWTDEDDEDDDQ